MNSVRRMRQQLRDAGRIPPVTLMPLVRQEMILAINQIQLAPILLEQTSRPLVMKAAHQGKTTRILAAMTLLEPKTQLTCLFLSLTQEKETVVTPNKEPKIS